MWISICAFIHIGRNIIIVGNLDVSKIHIVLALRHFACEANRRVLFVIAPNLILELQEFLNEREDVADKKKFISCDLVILNEFGYVALIEGERTFLIFFLTARKKSRLFWQRTLLLIRGPIYL